MRLALVIALVALCTALVAQSPAQDLPHGLAPGEEHIPLGRDFAPTPPPQGPVRPVAEWEPMRGALVRWAGSLGIPWELAAELAEDDVLVTIVGSAAQQASAQTAYAAHGVNLAHCEWLLAPTNSMWTRDYGPFFIMTDSLAVVDFIYNRPRPYDDAIPSAYAAWDSLPCYGMSLAHTGGNWMTDGDHIAASTTLVYTENSGQSTTQVNEQIAAYTGCTTYHALPDPLGEYIEHIDCWGKYLAPNKVLIGRVPSVDVRFADYEAVAAHFAAANCAWGVPYEVYRVDTPGDWPYTPYTNSLILNGKVFVPQTGHELDDDALAVYTQAMPGYEVLGMDYTGWQNTDALHCRVHELPDKRMLELRCVPLLGQQPAQDSLLAQVTARAHSGAELPADSLRIYWRIPPEQQWTSLALQHTAGDSFAVRTPPVQDEVTVEYWFRAVDASGRAAMQPVMGPHDPFRFSAVFTALDAPQQPRIMVSDGMVHLSWQPVANATAYRVWVAPQPDAEDWDMVSEVTETSLSLPREGERKFYRVSAVRP